MYISVFRSSALNQIPISMLSLISIAFSKFPKSYSVDDDGSMLQIHAVSTYRTCWCFLLYRNSCALQVLMLKDLSIVVVCSAIISCIRYLLSVTNYIIIPTNVLALSRVSQKNLAF